MKANPLARACFLTLTSFLATSAALHSQPYAFVTVAGIAGKWGSADGTNSTASFSGPEGLAADTSGNLFLADADNNSVRRLSKCAAGWVVTTLAGTPPFSGHADGTNGAASFSMPRGIAVATNGDLYVTDYSSEKIRKVSPVGADWVVTTLTLTGDGIWTPRGIAIDAVGNLFVTDYLNNTICRVSPDGTNWAVKIIAGVPGAMATVDGTNSDARFAAPSGIAVDAAGNLYIGEYYSATIRKIAPSETNWVVTTIAGSNRGFGTTDGTNSAAQFQGPRGVAIDQSGTIFVADEMNNNIRKVTPNGTDWVVTTIGGAGPNQNRGSSDGIGTDARFYAPRMLTVDQSGNLFVADTQNYTIRQGRQYQPPLYIAARGKNVELSWPTNATGFRLEKSSSLAGGVVWATVQEDPVLSGNTCVVTNDAIAPAAFYRLRW